MGGVQVYFFFPPLSERLSLFLCGCETYGSEVCLLMLELPPFSFSLPLQKPLSPVSFFFPPAGDVWNRDWFFPEPPLREVEELGMAYLGTLPALIALQISTDRNYPESGPFPPATTSFLPVLPDRPSFFFLGHAPVDFSDFFSWFCYRHGVDLSPGVTVFLVSLL